MYIYEITIEISADPSRLGVSELMLHPVPYNSPNAQTALYSHNPQTCPNSVCFSPPRFSDSLDSQFLRASVRIRLSI